MDVVDLAQPRERAADREIERPCALPARAHRGAKSQQACAFGGPRARDPGADGVDEVKRDELARGLGETLAPASGDMAAELVERAHVRGQPTACWGAHTDLGFTRDRCFKRASRVNPTCVCASRSISAFTRVFDALRAASILRDGCFAASSG